MLEKTCSNFNASNTCSCFFSFSGYRLVIICSSDKEDSSLIVSKLNHLRVPYLPPQDLSRYKEYLDTHFKSDSTPSLSNLRYMQYFYVLYIE